MTVVNDNMKNVKSPSDTTLYKPALCRRINADISNQLTQVPVNEIRKETDGDNSMELIKKISDFVDSVRIDQRRRESLELVEHQEKHLPQPMVTVPGQEEARRHTD